MGFLSSRAPDTQTRYIESVVWYVKFLREQCGLTINNPDDLLMARKAIKIEERMIDFVLWLKQRGLSFSLINMRYWALRKFYGHNRIICNWDIIRDNMPKNERKNKDIRAYRLEEIQRMVQLAGLRLRMVIILLATSGLRIGALSALNKGSLTRINKYGIFAIKAYEGESEQYITFASPEFTVAVDEYFADRERAGEIITDESPLIRDEYDRLRGASDARRLKTTGIENELYRFLITNGFRTKMPPEEGKSRRAYRAQVQLSYGLRKWYKRMLRKSGVDPICLEYLMNHKKGDIKAGITELMMTYDPAEKYELLEEYAKAIPNLIIDEAYHERIKSETLQRDLESTKTEQQKTIDKLQGNVNNIQSWLADLAHVLKNGRYADDPTLAALGNEVQKLAGSKPSELAHVEKQYLERKKEEAE